MDSSNPAICGRCKPGHFGELFPRRFCTLRRKLSSQRRTVSRRRTACNVLEELSGSNSLKLIGFAVWERRSVSGRNVTFPARQYSVNGERRSLRCCVRSLTQLRRSACVISCCRRTPSTKMRRRRRRRNSRPHRVPPSAVPVICKWRRKRMATEDLPNVVEPPTTSGFGPGPCGIGLDEKLSVSRERSCAHRATCLNERNELYD